MRVVETLSWCSDLHGWQAVTGQSLSYISWHAVVLALLDSFCFALHASISSCEVPWQFVKNVLFSRSNCINYYFCT